MILSIFHSFFVLISGFFIFTVNYIIIYFIVFVTKIFLKNWDYKNRFDNFLNGAMANKNFWWNFSIIFKI